MVTVCVTTFNRKELLKLTLISILNQTYKTIEIIIVDDCSTDGTQEFVKNELLKLDKRIKYIRHKKNKGLAASRNSAIMNASGKYFTFCDDDDIWEANFIEEFIKVASRYSDDWCFYCGCKYKNLLGTTISVIYNYEGTIKEHIKDGYTPPVASQFYNLKSLKRVAGYNIDVKSGVDHDLWIRLAKIDLNIKSIPLALSIPNANAKQERMTTNYHKRINGLENSLLIWKQDLKDLYGKDFYLDFTNAYFEREKLKFLKKYLKEFDFLKAYTIKENISNLSFFKMSIMEILKFTIKFLIPNFIVKKEKIILLRPTLKLKRKNL